MRLGTPFLKQLPRQLCLPSAETSLEGLWQRRNLIVGRHVFGRVLEPEVLMNDFLVRNAVFADELFYVFGLAV